MGVAPALRIGWVCGEEKMIEGLAGVRQDLGVSQWLARMMTAFMAEGKLDPHIASVNEVYRRRRDTAIAAVREHCGDHVRFDVPQGGFYLWLELDESVDWDQVGPRAAENTRAAVDYCKAHPHWRLSLQTHKYLGIP